MTTNLAEVSIITLPDAIKHTFSNWMHEIPAYGDLRMIKGDYVDAIKTHLFKIREIYCGQIPWYTVCMLWLTLKIIFAEINYCVTEANRGVTVFQQRQITAIKDWAFK